MLSNQKGFTLIELLVVVLIIGILAAVALPQYQTSVLKSRFTHLESMARAIQKAQQVYKLENGAYATDIEHLDISFSSNYYKVGDYIALGNFRIYIALGDELVYVLDWSNGIGYMLAIEGSGRRCVSYTIPGDRMCQSLGGVYYSTACGGNDTYHGCNQYILP